MLEYKKVVKTPFHYPFTDCHPKEKTLFFDIETTGLSAKSSFLYLIGCIYYEKDQWHMIQWFNNDSESEELMLQNFLLLVSNYDTLIHYNGKRFDLPYLIERCNHFHLKDTFSNLNQIDFYQVAKAYRSILCLSSLSQHSVEQFFQLNRTEFQSGEDLIVAYYIYLKSNNLHQQQQLLIHNQDDLIGLLTISNLYSFQMIKNGNYTISNWELKDHIIRVQLEFQGLLPHIIKNNDYCQMEIENNTLVLSIPIINGRIRNYYSNYKDYYYLPAEDMAVHKKLSTYVSKYAKEKATPDTCYTWVSYHDKLLNESTIVSYTQSVLYPFFA